MFIYKQFKHRHWCKYILPKRLQLRCGYSVGGFPVFAQSLPTDKTWFIDKQQCRWPLLINFPSIVSEAVKNWSKLDNPKYRYSGSICYSNTYHLNAVRAVFASSVFLKTFQALLPSNDHHYKCLVLIEKRISIKAEQ